LLLASFQNLGDDGNGYVIVRVFESLNSTYKSSITVTDGESIIKSIDLNTMRPKNVSDNVLVISKTLNELKDQGYLIAASSSGGNQAFTQTDYIFEKK
jgi:hypothetical protein